MQTISKLAIAAFVIGLLGGCVTATPLTAPDGQQGFSLNCAAFRDIGMCYKKAGEICGSNGYKVITQNSDNGGALGAASNNLVMRCKNASDRE